MLVKPHYLQNLDEERNLKRQIRERALIRLARVQVLREAVLQGIEIGVLLGGRRSRDLNGDARARQFALMVGSVKKKAKSMFTAVSGGALLPWEESKRH